MGGLGFSRKKCFLCDKREEKRASGGEEAAVCGTKMLKKKQKKLNPASCSPLCSETDVQRKSLGLWEIMEAKRREKLSGKQQQQ